MSWEVERKKCEHCGMERDDVWIRCDLCGISSHVENRVPLTFSGSKLPNEWQHLIVPESRPTETDPFHLCPKCRLKKRGGEPGKEKDEAKTAGQRCSGRGMIGDR